MQTEIAMRRDEITELRRSNRVSRLEVFGPAARGTALDPASSDADFLAEFGKSSECGGFRRHFVFQAALAAVLDRETDLLSALQKNRHFLAGINECREAVFEV